MKVAGVHHRSIAYDDARGAVRIVDQTRLPFEFVLADLRSATEVARAIQTMQVRGAPLIGVAAAFGLALAAAADPSDPALDRASRTLMDTRPTAVNLRWAIDRVRQSLREAPPTQRGDLALCLAREMAEEDVETCRRIGEHGAGVLRRLWEAKSHRETVHVLTHCNAGWLATVDWGTALSGVYQAHDQGIPLHVWVDETRPRSQGWLTAWELSQHGVPCTAIADNAGGHLMQHRRVDVCLVGSDRTTARGDVCNKIGTYLKALAARDNGIPFYAALPRSTLDFTMDDGRAEIPIEERDPDEVHRVRGTTEAGVTWVRTTPGGVAASNPAFDVTPAHLVTGIITERGVAPATREGLLGLYPEERR